jgi:hypothetical protein
MTRVESSRDLVLLSAAALLGATSDIVFAPMLHSLGGAGPDLSDNNVESAREALKTSKYDAALPAVLSFKAHHRSHALPKPGCGEDLIRSTY